MNRSNLKVFSNAIAKVAFDSQALLSVELAASFAVINDCGDARRLARAMLCEMYVGAGYHCKDPSDFDWVKFNRRISAALALYDFLNKDGEVDGWCEGKQRTELLNALVERIKPLKLKTVNEIMEICGKRKRTLGPRTPHPRHPLEEIPGALHVDTEHVHIIVPPETTRAELMEVAMALMKLAEQVAQAPGGDTVAEVSEAAEVE
jgi:hypothetical protein